jgi:hypothetical protein
MDHTKTENKQEQSILMTELQHSKNNISEEQIKEFQKSLSEHIQSIIVLNSRRLVDTMYKPLNERIDECLDNLERREEELHVSDRNEESYD